MPSSSDTRGVADALAGSAVRPVRFERPLHAAGPGARTPGWGDAGLDGALAEAVEAARAEGLAQGYAAGWAAGRQAAAEREAAETVERARAAEADRRALAARAESLLAALAAAATSAATAAEPTWDELGDVLADGALALARAALARELASVDADLELRMRAALRLLAGDGRVVVLLAPQDAAALAGVRLPEGTELVADAALAPGTVAVRTDARRLLLDVPAAIAAAEEVLRS
jgi:flagellar assembly protein FliH